MKKIEFEPYGLVYTDNVDIYDVAFIIIDEGEKTIDLCDQWGMSIGNIHYENEKEVGYLKYDKDERLTGDYETIIKNGEVVIT